MAYTCIPLHDGILLVAVYVDTLHLSGIFQGQWSGVDRARAAVATTRLYEQGVHELCEVGSHIYVDGYEYLDQPKCSLFLHSIAFCGKCPRLLP